MTIALTRFIPTLPLLLHLLCCFGMPNTASASRKDHYTELTQQTIRRGIGAALYVSGGASLSTIPSSDGSLDIGALISAGFMLNTYHKGGFMFGIMFSQSFFANRGNFYNAISLTSSDSIDVGDDSFRFSGRMSSALLRFGARIGLSNTLDIIPFVSTGIAMFSRISHPDLRTIFGFNVGAGFSLQGRNTPVGLFFNVTFPTYFISGANSADTTVATMPQTELGVLVGF